MAVFCVQQQQRVSFIKLDGGRGFGGRPVVAQCVSEHLDRDCEHAVHSAESNRQSTQIVGACQETRRQELMATRQTVGDPH